MKIQNRDDINVVPKHGEALYRDLFCARLEESSNRDPDSECLQSMWKCWITEVPPGVELEPHTHQDHEQIYYILRGSGVVSVGDEERAVRAGDCIYMPPDVPHGFVNNSDEEVGIFTVGANIFRPWMTRGVAKP